MSDAYDDRPLVYACSGCSSAAQMANDLAVRLDRDRHAEMSCIAGVGGDVAPLVADATSGRPMLVVDGCPLECARICLDGHGVEPDVHVKLFERGVPKAYHRDYDAEQADAVYEDLVDAAAALESTEDPGVTEQ